MKSEILSITDPRDAFVIMLLERIEKLEDTVRDLSKSLTELKDKHDNFLVPVGFTSFQAIQAIKLSFDCFNTADIEAAKQVMAECCHLIEERLGKEVLSSVCADIILDESLHRGYTPYNRIYINFKRLVWVHEVTRVLASITYPTKSVGTVLSKGAIAFYTTASRFSGMQENGLVYNLYDKDGNRKTTPVWESYTAGYEFLTNPYPDELYSGSDDGSDDGEWWPEQIQ